MTIRTRIKNLGRAVHGLRHWARMSQFPSLFQISKAQLDIKSVMKLELTSESGTLTL